jgi:hypothetical protein
MQGPESPHISELYSKYFSKMTLDELWAWFDEFGFLVRKLDDLKLDEEATWESMGFKDGHDAGDFMLKMLEAQQVPIFTTFPCRPAAGEQWVADSCGDQRVMLAWSEAQKLAASSDED